MEIENQPISPSSSRDAILPTDPVVSVGIEVGKKLKNGQTFEVDYPALRETLRTVGAPEDNSSLSVTFNKKLSAPLGVVGYYDSGEKHVFIKLRGKNKTQITLQHELRHYTDFLVTPLMAEELRSYKIGQFAMVSANTLGASSIILGAANISSEFIPLGSPEHLQSAQDIISSTQLSAIGLSVAALGVGSVLYRAHKRERTARKAEALEAPTVVSMPKQIAR